MVVGVPCTVIIGLLLAVALNQGIGKLRAVFRVGFYLPVVTSIVAVAVVWRYMLDPDIGILNMALAQVGITGPDWLGQPNTTMPSIIALGVWRNIGNSMIILLAALQTVDPQLYEAARVDGAKGRHLFRHITVPQLRPALLFTTVVTSIGYLQVFEEPFVMSGPNGAPDQAGFTASLFVYQQGFRFFNLGYASAAAYTRVHRDRRAGDHPVPLPEAEDMTAVRTAARAARDDQGREPRGPRPRAVVALRPARARHAADDRAVRVDAARRVQDQRRLHPHDADAAAGDVDARQLHAAVLQAGLRPLLPQLARGSRSWSRPRTWCSARWPATRSASCASPGSRPLMGLVLATLMVPGSVTLVPLFVLMSKLGLVNSYAAVTVPFFAGAFGVFLMRQFMTSIPDDLLEAARIDGAGEWTIFTRIVMPLMKPALAALAVFTFLATWNNFLWPLVALTDQTKYTLPVALATFSIGQNKADYGLLMAGSVVLVAPVIVLFIALQRHFTQSIATTGLKG